MTSTASIAVSARDWEQKNLGENPTNSATTLKNKY